MKRWWLALLLLLVTTTAQAAPLPPLSPAQVSSITGAWTPDAGIGWNLDARPSGQTWVGSFTGTLPPPGGQSTVAGGSWSSTYSTPLSTAQPDGQAQYTVYGYGWNGTSWVQMTFAGTMPPSPPSPQWNDSSSFAGSWVVDSSHQNADGTWTWHGTWTGATGF